MIENSQESNIANSFTSDSRRDGVITVVLTADNHLGYTTFGQQPRKRAERQQRLRYAFQQAADFAVGQGVDLFIQAGDLFDTVSPDERDRSFVAERLARLKQAGVRTFALGGVHDTPHDIHSSLGESTPAPQISYARLGALNYLPPTPEQGILEPIILDIHGVLVGICGMGVVAGQEGDILAKLKVIDDIERAAVKVLVLHAPLEGLTNGSSLLDTRAVIQRESILQQSSFDYILAGYSHSYNRTRIGHTDVIIAGATQHIDFHTPDTAPGFVFLGIAADGIRWCNHIAVDTLRVQQLVLHTKELWEQSADKDSAAHTPTEQILARLRPLCDAESMIQLRLEGELTRRQYHQLDLNQIRRYGEEQCFALAIDDSSLVLVTEQDSTLETGERFSPREELIALADEWIAAASDEQEQKALRATKEELLLALDEVKSRR